MYTFAQIFAGPAAYDDHSPMVESNNEEERDERIQRVLDALKRKPVEPKRFTPIAVTARSTPPLTPRKQRLGENR